LLKEAIADGMDKLKDITDFILGLQQIIKGLSNINPNQVFKTLSIILQSELFYLLIGYGSRRVIAFSGHSIVQLPQYQHSSYFI